MNDTVSGEKLDSSTVLIPWTGGYDSTALLLKALSEGRRVYVPYVDITNNESNCASEKTARARIHKYLTSIDLWRGDMPKIVAQVTNWVFSNGTSYQYPKWIIYACADLPDDVKEIWIGYTKSDRTADGFNLDHHCHLIPAISAMTTLTCHKTVEIKFPFYDVDKVDMLKYYIPLNVRKVFEMLANCTEGLSYESGCRCNKCMKLETLRTILYSQIK